jgi:hypothetical protein
MFSRIESTRRSNHSIFLPQNFGSPFNDMAEHIAGLGLARIDLERRQVAGEVIYTVGARQNSEISVKHFIALNTAAENQRERL